jgi:hypothetical protein
MDIFFYYFDIVSPLKLVTQRAPLRKSQITQGIYISNKQMCWVNCVEKRITFIREKEGYMNRYQMKYNTVIKKP